MVLYVAAVYSDGMMMITSLRNAFWGRPTAKQARLTEEQQRRRLEQEQALRARLEAFVGQPAAQPSAGE